MIVLAPSRLRHISHMHRHLSQEIAPLRIKIRHLPAGGPTGRTGSHLTVYARLQLAVGDNRLTTCLSYQAGRNQK